MCYPGGRTRPVRVEEFNGLHMDTLDATHTMIRAQVVYLLVPASNP